MNDPADVSFRDRLVDYLNVDNLSEETKEYIEKLCTAMIAWIAKNITTNPTPSIICEVLTSILSLEVATPYISRVKDIETKFNQYYTDKVSHTDIFQSPNRILVIDIETIFHRYYPGGCLDIFQSLVVILQQMLDTLRPLLESNPNSTREEILNHLLHNVPNREDVISKIDQVLIPTPINSSNFTPITYNDIIEMFNNTRKQYHK